MRAFTLHLHRILLAGLVILFSAFAAIAQTTTFTYQGKLHDDYNQPTGAYDLQFNLYDEATGSHTPLNATPVVLEDIQVTSGMFAVALDFGNLFEGSDRYLEVGVRPANDTGAFTVSSPRQQITSAPYSIRSLSAATSDTATNAQSLGGTASGDFVQTTDARLTDARPPITGSNNYIQNTSSLQSGTNFNIAGTGTASVFNATTQFNIGGNRVLSTVGENNVFAGFNTGVVNTTGIRNSFFGYNAGAANTTGRSNSFFGREAGVSNVSGINNTFIGSDAGISNTTGNENEFVGASAGQNNTTGNSNSFFGTSAGNMNSSGSGNSFSGSASGIGNTTGKYNSFAGWFAGSNNTTGSNNTIMGADANFGANNLSFATAIGSHARVNTSDTIILGKVARLYDGVSRPADTVLIPGNLTVLGTINGGAGGGNPTNIDASNITTGTLNNARLDIVPVGKGGTGITSAGANGNFLRSNGTGFTSSALQIGDVPDLSARYLQNTTTQQANANFNISGSGVVGGNLSVSGTLNASGAGLTDLNASNIATGTLDSARLGLISTSNIADGAVNTPKIVDSAVTAAKIGSNQVVKNVNGLTDGVNLAAGANVTITPSGNTLTISAAAAGGNFIQNATTQQANSNFNISGDGTAANLTASSTLSGNIVNTATQFNIGGSRVLSVAGMNNIFAGSGAGNSNTTGSYNAFFGKDAGYNNMEGSSNSFLGFNAGVSNTAGNGNSFFGVNTGGHNTVGYYNSFFGTSAGLSNTEGDYNSFVGGNTGYGNTTGHYNSYLGFQAGFANTVGSNNTILGANADVGANNLTFATAVGSYATVTTSNTIALGRSNGLDKVRIFGLGAAGSAHLCRNVSNEVSTCSSSLRYKTNIAPFSPGLGLIQHLRPIRFEWKDGGMKDIGFGAEDVAAVEPLLVTYDDKGRVEGVKYDRISTVLVNAVKEQQTQIETQQTQLKQQQAQIEAQQQQLRQQQNLIDGLKKLLCQQNPTADICR